MRNIKPTKVFISGALAELNSATNARRQAELACDLALIDGITFREVVGCFEGSHEPAFCVFIQPGVILETIDALVNLGVEYNQASVLVVHGDDAAELCECGTSCSAFIGRFQVLPGDDEPEPGEDYTFADGRFYVVR